MLALGAACFDSVSLSGASKTLGVGYLCSQLAQGFSAVKAKVVFEGQCGFGDIRDQGELRMKEAIWEGDFVVSVVPREVKGGVWEAGCEIWVARCDLGEGAVMGEGCLSLLILVDGFPHNSYLPFCFLPQAQVALCCKQVLTLGSVGGCHKPGMQNGNWGAVVSVSESATFPSWCVNFTHRGQSPLLSTTYFLLRSDNTPPSSSQPILISHPSSFASVASPCHFQLPPSPPPPPLPPDS